MIKREELLHFADLFNALSRIHALGFVFVKDEIEALEADFSDINENPVLWVSYSDAVLNARDLAEEKAKLLFDKNVKVLAETIEEAFENFEDSVLNKLFAQAINLPEGDKNFPAVFHFVKAFYDAADVYPFSQLHNRLTLSKNGSEVYVENLLPVNNVFIAEIPERIFAPFDVNSSSDKILKVILSFPSEGNMKLKIENLSSRFAGSDKFFIASLTGTNERKLMYFTVPESGSLQTRLQTKFGKNKENQFELSIINISREEETEIQ